MEPKRDENETRKAAEGEGPDKMNHEHAWGYIEHIDGRKRGVRSSQSGEPRSEGGLKSVIEARHCRT